MYEGNTVGPKVILIGIVVAALVIFSISAFHVVPPGHRGVAITLGKVSPTFRPEGPTIKIPFIQQIVNVPIKQITETGHAEAFSSDLQTVKVKFNILYRIPEARVVELLRDYRGNPYDALIEPRIQEAVKQVAAVYRAEDLVKNREKIKLEAIEKVRKDTGGLLTIVDLVINNIDLTDELERAIEQKTIREQEALAKEFELKKAQKEAEITIVNAEAEAKAVEIKGRALKASPAVIELEIAKRWDGKSPSSVVVGRGGANVLLPLK